MKNIFKMRKDSKMKTARYKAKWIYSDCCLRKGEVFAECAADSLPEFASQLCATYAYGLGDGFSFLRFESQSEINDCFGEDRPDWFDSVDQYPVLLFSSNFGEEILCNPTSTQIINQIRNEGYGDYNLTITGI